MTVSSPINKKVYGGNGATTSFPFDFRVEEASHLRVFVTDASGAEVLLSASQYSVAGIGSLYGGQVTYPLVGAPLGAGSKITLLRQVPYTQNADIQNQGGFYPKVIEGALDNIVWQVQQLAEESVRSVKLPPSESPGEQISLPGLSRRADKLPVFNAAGAFDVLNDGAGVVYLNSAGKPGVLDVTQLLTAIGTTILDDGIWLVTDDPAANDDGVWG